MTFTMLSYDRRTDEYGACIRTSVPCVGALALQVSRRGAVCSQAYVNSDLALRVIEDLEDGTSAEEAVREALESDPQPDLRQVGALSAGTMFVHTGLDTLNWRGSRCRRGLCGSRKPHVRTAGSGGDLNEVSRDSTPCPS